MRHLKTWRLFESWKPKFDRQTIWDAIEWHDSYRDLFPGYGNEQDFSDEYYFDSRGDAEQFADNVIDTFDSLPDPIPVYRAIKADSEEDIDLDDPGESWSFERESAIEFGSHNFSNYLLTAEVSKQDVNWAGTIKAYAIFSGGYSSEDENEIVIDDPEAIKNIRVEEI